MDATTKWLVTIACLVFLGGVIATLLSLKQQKLENFCIKTAIELSLIDEPDKYILKYYLRGKGKGWELINYL